VLGGASFTLSNGRQGASFSTKVLSVLTCQSTGINQKSEVLLLTEREMGELPSGRFV